MKVYRVTVFKSKDENVLKYRGVNGANDFQKFKEFLNKSHSTWKYFNVYDKMKQYVKRIYA